MVPEVSAKGGQRGINEFLVFQQTDHHTICKPYSRIGEAYAVFLDFLMTKISADDPCIARAPSIFTRQ